ncbi:phosphoribosylformylglycinamidine cyclo-ligase, partial [bacterium]|nr:phosphoribosylformylglycinamidine cyclo-ligase [candidate division CSSED10-310 bacterium]
MTTPKKLSYRDAGVDIDRADAFVDRIRPMAASTRTVYSMDSIGSFAGLLDLTKGSWREPLLVACTDGVGTKLKVAFETGCHQGVGIDLVAMSVNDLLVTGAQPLAFLDYLATSRLDLDLHAAVVDSIAEGCRRSGCALLGGETAELPGFYQDDEYDLAGFAVGVVDRERMLSVDSVRAGDWVIGIPSDGLHSNGFSLVRKVFEDRSIYPIHRPLEGMTEPLGDVLLKPTRIYRREMETAAGIPGVRSAAHITGGGIPGNLPRAVPDHLGIAVVRNTWPVHPIFEWIRKAGGIEEAEMDRTFNMGLGLMVVTAPDAARTLMRVLADQGFDSYRVGWITGEPGFRWVDRFEST